MLPRRESQRKQPHTWMPPTSFRRSDLDPRQMLHSMSSYQTFCSGTKEEEDSVRAAQLFSSGLTSFRNDTSRSGRSTIASPINADSWLLDFFSFPVSASGRCPRSRDIPAQTPEISAAVVGSERHQT